jgi:hypothetical protein
VFIVNGVVICDTRLGAMKIGATEILSTDLLTGGSLVG